MTPRDRDPRAPRPLVVFLLTLLLLAPLTHDRVFRSGNDASRFAQIESLVDHGATSIDASRYAWTTDRVVIDGRSYSNKPPLLAIIGAGVYYALRAAGLSFSANEHAVAYLLTLLLVGVPTAWLVARFATALYRTYPDRPSVRLLTVVALASATLLTSFSVTLNSHTVAAVLLFAGWMEALERRPALAGACVALAAAIDVVPGVVLLPAIAYPVWERSGRRGLARAAAAVGGGAILAAGLNVWIVGSVLPPLLAPGASDQSGGKNVGGLFANIAIGRGLERPAAALGAALFGGHGFLAVSPILLAGVAGLAVASRRGAGLAGEALPQRGGTTLPHRGTTLPQCGMRVTRGEAVAVALASAVLAAGHALLVLSLGGWAYGYRYLIPLVPLLLFFVPAAVAERGRWPLAALVAVSIPLALLGAYHPWPPVWEPETPGQGLDAMTNPVGVNLGAWLFEHAPDAPFTGHVISRFISSDARARNHYLYLFQRSKGRNDRALEPYLYSLRRDPGQPATHYDLAEALAAVGALDQAAQQYGRALQLAPDFEPARRGLAQTLTEIERRRHRASAAPGSALEAKE